MSNPNKSSLLDSLSNTIGDWLLHDLARRGTCARDRGTGYFRALLDEFGVRYSCEEQEIHRIPKAGPVVLVANHPFGLAEGPILGDLLASLRPDTKFLANSLLTAIPDLGQYLIPVDPFGGVRATKTNWKGIRDSLQWLKDGHLLVTFPAGEVASFQWPHLDIVDPHWHWSTL